MRKLGGGGFFLEKGGPPDFHTWKKTLYGSSGGWTTGGPKSLFLSSLLHLSPPVRKTPPSNPSIFAMYPRVAKYVIHDLATGLEKTVLRTGAM
ncbi:hypothetical protein HG531_012739 [Fusarium graminearum]|nr:hypothetical protein HG531_012739 [Fusarium graminearum]